MSGFFSKVKVSAGVAVRSAWGIAVAVLVGLSVRFVIEGLFYEKWSVDWRFALEFAAILGGAWFFLIFAYTFFKLRANEPVDQILTEQDAGTLRLTAPMPGFVAMEYYGLISNRTFVIFVAPDGLYGWKAEGLVDCSTPFFFRAFEQMLDDDNLMTNPEAVRRLSQLKGGFFIPRTEIVSVEAVYKQKWGMGPIPHSGRIKVRMVSGRSREFILLGNAEPEVVAQNVMQGRSTAVHSNSRRVALPYVARTQNKLRLPLLAGSLALSVFFIWNYAEVWAGNWAYRVTSVLIIASPVLLLWEFAVQKLTFTETDIERTTRTGAVVRHPYSSIRNISPAYDAFVVIHFSTGRKLKIHTFIGNPRDILGILEDKCGTKVEVT